jgi:hypothetical protein
VALWLFKDVVLMTATYMHVKQKTEATVGKDAVVWDPITTPLQVNPTTISKVNTALQFVTLAVGIAHPALLAVAATAAATGDTTTPTAVMLQHLATAPILPALCWLTGATTLASFGSYLEHSAFTEVVVRNTKTTPQRKQ